MNPGVPLVSVVIPNYNYGRYVGEAVESVLAQTYPNVEIVVVDDGSKDDSREVLGRFGDRIKLVEQSNGGPGPAKARNRGAAESSGEYLCFLDADDRWLPTKVQRQIERFQADPELGFVHVGEEKITSQGEPIGVILDGHEGWIAEEMLVFGRNVIVAGGSGVMVPRRIFDEVGAFDTRLSISEDFDLCFRVAARYRVGFIAEPLIQVRSHDSSAQTSSAGVRRIEHDMRIVFAKIFEGSSATPEITRHRRRAYGRLHRVLSGSYFVRHELARALAHGARAVWYAPEEAAYILAAPLRRLRRRIDPQAKPGLDGGGG